VERLAGVDVAHAQSPSVTLEIDRAIARASDLARSSRSDAINFLEEKHGEYPDDPKLLTYLAYWYYREYERTEARQLLERAIEMGSELPETYAYLAEVQFHDRLYADGLRQAQRALNFSPRDVKANQIAAQCLLKIVERQSLQLDRDRHREMITRARTYAERSVISDDWSMNAQASNRRAQSLIERANELLHPAWRAFGV
jgi:tetratricopeptide (TPR) repeat protein